MKYLYRIAMGLALFLMVFVWSCSKKPGTTAPKESPQPASSKQVEAARPAAHVVQDISDNPAYYSATEVKLASPELEKLDSAIRPVLKKLLGDARLTAEGGAAVPGDIVNEGLLGSMTYVPRKLLDSKECDNLHTTMLASGFGMSPRVGAKPAHGRTLVLMSFFARVGTSSYSITVKADLEKQTIEVRSYALGSKYDRM